MKENALQKENYDFSFSLVFKLLILRSQKAVIFEKKSSHIVYKKRKAQKSHLFFNVL